MALLPDLTSASTPEEHQAALWVDDFTWHRKMFRQARWRWFPETAIAVVAHKTGGRLDFSSTSDVPFLDEALEQVYRQRDVAQWAIAEKIVQTSEVIPDLDTIAELLGLPSSECSHIVWLYKMTRPTVTSDRHTSEVLEYVPFRNPLTEAWELKQLLRLYDAACAIAEDALCDLLDELLETRPAQTVLPLLAREHTEAQVRERIAHARRERGEPGDPRRLPEQTF